MPVRKWYEEAAKKIAEYKKALQEVGPLHADVSKQAKVFEKLLKDAQADADGGAKMAAMKPHETAFKAVKKAYKEWEVEREKWDKKASGLRDEIDDLTIKIFDRFAELTKDELEHIEKHTKRVEDAKRRVAKAIEAKLDIEERKHEDAVKNRLTKKKEAKELGVDDDTPPVPDFSRKTRREELMKVVLLNAAEGKAVAAAEKRIAVYKQIREKKLKRYKAINDALKDFAHVYRPDKI